MEMLLLWLVLLMLVLLLLLSSLVWCWHTFSPFYHVYLLHVISNLALNHNPLILLYCTIYFLTLSVFIFPYLLIVSSIHFFALPFFQSNISRCGNFSVVPFSKFNSSHMLEFDDPLLIYSSCLIFPF